MGLSFLTLQRRNAVLDALRPVLECGANALAHPYS
ncbi:DUF1534 domain-containing protein [Pseudomonas syringae pv. actinidiae]|nr:DUF1534 domain-containing protein [Pseudomonas syringae pv. actinidiae]AYL81551.1 DUF1534 domain-containing protein [Pseudomonas syringae pv. actinidiae str. Shaanxi_M228]